MRRTDPVSAGLTRFPRFRGVGAAALFLLLASPVLADDPPIIQYFRFTFETQLLEFHALDPKGQGFNYQVSSSSSETTFSGPTSMTVQGPGGGGEWFITPGNAAVGEIHTFQIQVTNANGTSRKTLKLEVVAGTGEGLGSLYREVVGFQVDVPATSPVGLVTLAVLLTLGAFAVLRLRKGA